MQWDRAKKYWECYKKAAELGHPVSQYVVGYIYSGENPNILSLIKEKANKTLAYEWFEKSAQAGWPNAKRKSEFYKRYAK
jgi:TPR repeat protein